MARRKTGYDAACYYGGKLMGRCTVADSDTYVALMEQCGGNAARVLQEYAYFSPELKGVLEKVAGIQAAQNRGTRPGASLYAEPEQSPWGAVQHCDTLCPGVFLVSTASHGGIMVSKDMIPMLPGITSRFTGPNSNRPTVRTNTSMRLPRTGPITANTRNTGPRILTVRTRSRRTIPSRGTGTVKHEFYRQPI